jgi:hypothetical protein
VADLAVMLVNSLRGRDPYAPLTGPSVKPRPVPPLDARGTSIEERRLRTLEPSTREFVVSVLSWARGNGIPAVLGETHRSEAEQARQAREGRTAIPEGQTGWHQYGRAFHLVIVDPRTRLLDEPSYERVGAEVRRRGGEWLGDRVLKTSRGEVRDLAHFEYHPGLKLSSFRDTPRARRELALAERRAARYG